MKQTLNLLIAAIALWSCSAIAEPLRVGVINLSPWGYTEKGGELSGQHIEIFDALSQRSGIPFEYSLLPLKRIKEQLKNSQTDMTVIFHRKEMSKFVEFIGLVMPYNYYLLGKNGVYFNEQTLSSVKKVGFVRGEGDVVKKCFTDKYDTNARLFPAKNYGNLLKMLNGDRLDAVTIPSKGLKAYLDMIGENQENTSRLFVLCRNEAYLQISRKSDHFTPEVIQKLQNTLDAMREDGTIERIAVKFAEVK